MSTALPVKPRTQSNTNGSRIAIVYSKYNSVYAESLLNNTKDELSQILPNTDVDVAHVPGAFEIPVTCEILLNLENPATRPNLIIALGVILQGETKHADLVASSVTRSLQEMAVRHKLPIIHEVLLLKNEQQAQARCIDQGLNRGREAARAAYGMLGLVNAISENNRR